MSEDQTQKPPEEPQQPKQPSIRVPVALGGITPRDTTELSATIANIANGGGFPTRFDTRAKQIAAYNLSSSLMGAQWQLALNHIAFVKGQLCVYGELPGTLAERTGQVAEKELYLIDKDYNRICVANKNLNAQIFGAVCIIQRKGRVKKEFSYTLDEAKDAGQYPATKRDGSPNPDSPWMKYTKIMLMRKAMAIAVKFEFPEAVVGVPIAEYDFDQIPSDDTRDVTDTSVKQANDFFKPGNSPQQGAENAADTTTTNNNGATGGEAGSGERSQVDDVSGADLNADSVGASAPADEQHFPIEVLGEPIDASYTDVPGPRKGKKKHRDQAVPSV